MVSPDSQEKHFEDRREYYFIHLTFQEFLAARYIARLFKQNDELSRTVALLEGKRSSQTISNQSLTLFMQNRKYDLRYERVWWFVAGLLKKDREGIERFFNGLRSEPRSFSGWYDFLLWIKCLEESKLTDNLSEGLKKDLIEEIRKIAQTGLDERARISETKYLKTFFEYLYSSPMVYGELGILHTQEALREALVILKGHSNLPISVVEKMVSLLSDKNEDVRSLALEALGQQPNLQISVLNEMVRLLSDENWDVQFSAPFALSRHQPNLPVSILNEVVRLLSDENDGIKYSAQYALGRQSNLPDSVLNEIVRLLGDKDGYVRNSALYVLGDQPNLRMSVLNEVVRLLSDEEWIVKCSALFTLGRQPNLQVSVLNEMMRLLSDESKHVRGWVLLALVNQPNLPNSILEKMVSLLSDKNETVRGAALKVLGRQPNLQVSVLNEIVSLLSDKKENVRRSALFTLGRQPNLRVSVLNEMVSLLSDKNETVRGAALKVLGRQPNLPDSALNEMERLLGDKNGTVRGAALKVLGRQPNLRVSVLNEMVRLLSDEKETVRSSALEALGQQPNLPASVLSNAITPDSQAYKPNVEFISQQLVPILDHTVLQLQLVSTPTLLSDVILENTFSGKNVVYFKDNQSLVIRLEQQLKQIKIKNKDAFIQTFIQQQKLWLNNRNTDYLLTQITDQFSTILLNSSTSVSSRLMTHSDTKN